jgi:hypothetical protein
MRIEYKNMFKTTVTNANLYENILIFVLIASQPDQFLQKEFFALA